MGKKKDARFTAPVDIVVHHYRSKLADPDNLSIKYVLDEIVSRGILRDDSAKEIRQISHWQHKVQNQAEERTEFRIEEVA